MASIEVSGRYPEKGRVVNDECLELVYVIRGDAMISVGVNDPGELAGGDVILVEKGEEYFWDGECELVISSAPAWYPEQHRMVE